MDLYTLSARFYPSVLVVTPIIAAVHAWSPDALDWKSIGLALTGGGVIAFLLAQLGRDKGKELEPKLFQMWGGAPTTRLLRHRHTSNAILNHRYHAGLQLITGQPMPTPNDENADPRAADQAYEAAVKYLRNATRDRSEFPLVFKENVNYGFRRNLVAMRGAAIAIAVIGSVACVGAGVWMTTKGNTSSSQYLLGAATSLWLTWLVVRVNYDWIKLAAYAYAERLLESIETLKEARDGARVPKRA